MESATTAAMRSTISSRRLNCVSSAGRRCSLATRAVVVTTEGASSRVFLKNFKEKIDQHQGSERNAIPFYRRAPRSGSTWKGRGAEHLTFAKPSSLSGGRHEVAWSHWTQRRTLRDKRRGLPSSRIFVGNPRIADLRHRCGGVGIGPHSR